MVRGVPQFVNLRGQVNTIFEMVPAFNERTGKTELVKKIVLSAEERALCLCCNKRKDSTVNGVCLSCTTSDKFRPR